MIYHFSLAQWSGWNNLSILKLQRLRSGMEWISNVILHVKMDMIIYPCCEKGPWVVDIHTTRKRKELKQPVPRHYHVADNHFHPCSCTVWAAVLLFSRGTRSVGQTPHSNVTHCHTCPALRCHIKAWTKMVAILQTAFSNAVSFMKSLGFGWNIVHVFSQECH